MSDRDQSSATADVIQLRTLGRIDVLGSDGTSCDAVVAQPKRMALLAFLALASARGFVRRDTLVAMFWPDLDDEHARGALSQALRFLRRELGDDAFSRRGEEEIALDLLRVTCDVAAFERAHQDGDHIHAIELYAGEFLEGLHVAQAPDVARWLDTERHRLSLLYAKSLDAMSDVLLRAGDATGALVYRRRLVAQDPYNGAVAIKYMQALVAAGDRAGAIAHASEHAESLASDLQAEPDPDVSSFAAQLRENPDRRSAGPIAASNQDHVISRMTPAPSPENAESSHDTAPTRARPLAIAIAVVAIAALLVFRQSPSPSAPPTRRQITHSGKASYPALSPDTRTIAFVEGEPCPDASVNCIDSLEVQDLAGGQTAPLAQGSRIHHPKWNPAAGSVLFQASRVVGAADTTSGGAYVVSWLGGIPQRVGPGGAAAFSTRGDTIAFASRVKSDTIRLRFLRSADLVVLDSASVPFRNGGLNDLDWSPDGKWLALLVYRGQGDRRVVLVSRPRGIVTDSITVRGLGLVRWVPAGDAVLLLLQGGASDDIVFRHGVDRRTGHFTSDTVTKLEIPAGGATFDVSRDGTTLAFVNGTSTLTELTAMERVGERVTSRSLSSFTGWSGAHVLSPDGHTIALSRADAQGENLYRIPFEGGDARPISPTPDHFATPVWLRDGRLVFKRGLPNTQLFVVNPTAGQPRPFGPAGYTTGNPYYLQWIDDSLYVLDQRDQHRVLILDSGGFIRDTLTVPDTLDQLLAATPDGRQLWFFGHDLGSGRFYSLDRLTRRVNVAFDMPPNSYAVGWAGDAYVFATWPKRTASSPTLWRVNSNGTFTRVAVLPTDCDFAVRLSMSRDGHRFVCKRTYEKRDIWLLHGLDLGR